MNSLGPISEEGVPPPNLSWLGEGFNVFGSFDSTRLYRMVDLGANTKKIKLFGNDYLVPATVNFDETPYTHGAAEAYASTTDCQQALMGEIYSKGKGTIRGIGLEGEVHARFGLTMEEDDSRYVATYNANYRYYSLFIDQPPTYDMLPEDARKLPQTYDSTTRAQFFKFFREFGVFCVKSIECGGRLQLNISSEDNAASSVEQMSLETTTAAEAFGIAAGQQHSRSEWSKLSSRWVQGSRLSWNAAGGIVGDLGLAAGSLNPAETPFIDGTALSNWAKSVPGDPTVIRFELTSIADLIDEAGDPNGQVNAIRKAATDFIGGSLKIVANHSGGSAKWDGGRADVQNDVMFVIIDRKDLSNFQCYKGAQLTSAIIEDALSETKFCVFFNGSGYAVRQNLAVQLLQKTSGAANLSGYQQWIQSTAGALSPFSMYNYAAVTWIDGVRVGLDEYGWYTTEITLAVPLWNEDGTWYGPNQPPD